MPNTAPTISNLNGDGVSFVAGSAAVRLDLGTNAAVTDPDPFGFEVRRVGTGLSGGPLFVVQVPDGSGRLYVVEKAGTIRIFDPATGAIDPTAFLNVSTQVATTGEQGLLGFALAPDFATSGVFYIYMTNTGGDNEVRRYSTFPGNLNQADPATADRILLSPHPGATNHNAGWIAFGPDGFLYIASGDGAVGSNAQSVNTLLGKILRIDPSSDGFPGDIDRDYAIPAGNPFAGATPGRDEIWAIGLRNPFRASFDSLTGDLWIGDVGQNRIEEIDFNPAGQAGLNFGWDVREGTLQQTGPDSPAFTPPVTEYGHGSGPLQGNSVTGGLVYRGPIAGLVGQYVFGDFFDKLWSVPASSLVQGSTLPSSAFTLRETAFTPNAGTIDQITSFATDLAGNLYITDLGGEVFQVQPSAAPNFAGGRLTVNISAGEVPAEDRLGLATGGAVTLSNGTNVDSQVRVGGILVGTIAPGGTGLGGDPLLILFSSGATAARISTLIQAVTYANAAADPTNGTRTITISVHDGAGTAIGGQDAAVVTTTVSVSDTGGQVFTGTPGDDRLVGTAGNDILQGLAGNDVLIGAGGFDNSNGGPGNDIHYVDSPNDVAVEAAGQGRDSVYASSTYTLREGQELEVLVTQDRNGAQAINLSGNSLANNIQGNAGANILLGNGGNDTMLGLAGNDTLNGGAGADVMNGGAGDDIYIIDDIGDIVVEAAGGGRDILFTDDGYFLREGQDIEVLAVENRAGTVALDLFGNSLANIIHGSDGVNRIDGRGGSDILVGYAAADTFAFTTALGPANIDQILGFAVEDRIALDNAVFTGLAAGALGANAFVVGPAAADADDRIVYDSASGALLFDADGAGGAAAVQFALLEPGLAVTAADFVVF